MDIKPQILASRASSACQDASTDWQEFTATDGRRYYYNKKTKQSSWEKPLELMTPREMADASTVWKEFTTAEGIKYYYNKDTKQSKWTIPDELKLAREQAEKEATDSDSDGHGDVPDYLEVSGRLERVGNKPVVRPSVPPTRSLSCGKRKVTEDDDCTSTSEGIQDVDEDTIQPRRSKRLRRTGGIIISEPTESATTTTARTAVATTKEIPATTKEIPVTTSSPTTTPTANIPSSSVSESSRIAVLEAQVASLIEQVATSQAQVASMSTQVEKLNQLVMDQRRLAVAQEEKIQGLEEFAEAQSSVFSKLKSSFVKSFRLG